MKKKVAISAGGSGGHLFPAQTLARQLQEEGFEVLFLGSGLAASPYFDRRQYRFYDVASATFSGKNPFKYLKGLSSIFFGLCQSYWVLRRFKPDIVVGFGSYQTFPAILGAKLCFRPIVLHESNAVPGKVNRFLSPYADRTALQFIDAAKHLKGNMAHVQMPFCKKEVSKDEAAAYYSLDPKKTTLLIFGGSQGAKKLNQLAQEAVVKHVDPYQLQVLHFLGKHGDCKKAALSYEERGISSVVKPFEKNMEYAWTLADVSLTRAGAASLAEQQEYGVPGILVPFPYATDNHQKKNAQAFIKETGGAVLLIEKQLTSDLLGQELASLIKNKEKRQKMMEGILSAQKRRGGSTLQSLIKQMLV